MKKRFLFAIAVFVLAFQGCISFTIGPERSFSESITKYQLSVQSVTRVTPKIKRLQYNSGTSQLYCLELVAEGRFVQHEGHSMKKGTPMLAVGLWPGCADCECKVAVVWCSILFNGALGGIPTLMSLCFEPFRDCHERNKNFIGDLADCGLVGFNKYYANVGKDHSKGFTTETTKNLSSYKLFGYSVMIDGKRLEDRDYGRGYTGEVYFESSRPSGSRISIRIVEAPSARSDGNDGFSGMEGLEITATLP